MGSGSEMLLIKLVKLKVCCIEVRKKGMMILIRASPMVAVYTTLSSVPIIVCQPQSFL